MDNYSETMKAFRFVEVGGALEAIRNCELKRMKGLHSDMAGRIHERGDAASEIVSNITAVDPKSGKVLTLAQFEEYVCLQRQLVDTLKEIPVSSEIQEEFFLMMTDSRKFIVPPEFKFSSQQPLTKLQKSDVESSHLYRCTSCLKLVLEYVPLKVGQLFLEVEQAKLVNVEVQEEILPMTEKVGSNLTIDQFEQYVALHRRLLSGSREVLDAGAKVHGEFEAMLRDTRKMIVPGTYHSFVREQIRSEQQSTMKNPDYPKVYLIGAYIFLVLTYTAGMFVSIDSLITY